MPIKGQSFKALSFAILQCTYHECYHNICACILLSCNQRMAREVKKVHNTSLSLPLVLGFLWDSRIPSGFLREIHSREFAFGVCLNFSPNFILNPIIRIRPNFFMEWVCRGPEFSPHDDMETSVRRKIQIGLVMLVINWGPKNQLITRS